MLNDELDVAILSLLAAGETRSEAMAAALGRPVRTVKYRLGRLRDAGLVESPARGTWHLTGAGNRAALSVTVPEPLAATDAFAALPAQHRAVRRLIEDAVVARRALEAVRPTSWPGFVLVGPVLTGKTLIGLLAARRFGLDPAAAIITLGLETPGTLLGQRVQDAGGVWRTEPSRLLALPLVVFDEYDKVGLELRRAAFTYLAGTHRRSPDDALAVHPTTIITLNLEGDLGALLPDSVLRRSVVLDTSGLLEATADLDLVEWDLVLAGLAPVATDLAPPAADLPETARSLLRAILRNCLTARGWGLVDGTSISRLALGRWATMPTAPEAAVRAVAADYLLVTETREGLVEPDWPARFEAVSGRSDGPIAATLATARDRQAAGEAREVSEERASLAASLEIAGTQARLLDALDHALKSAPRTELTGEERATKVTAFRKAHRLRAAITGARSNAALDELEVLLGREVLTPIGTVAAAREARRQQAELERQRRQEDNREARRRAHEAAQVAEATRQAAQRAAKSRRAAVTALCRRTTTRPREDVLGALLDADCLTRHDERHGVETIGSVVANSPIGRAVRARLAPAKPPPSAAVDRWALDRRALYSPGAFRPVVADPRPNEPTRHYKTETSTWYVDHGGQRYYASDLVAWESDAVRAVLEAAAEAVGLPRSSWPKRRARTPAVTAARASGRSA
ncbi:MAG: winged helix-turn-helix transcriptional regulator [Chloroflexi bacterium]|nr:winged helix-turn-helix transcriptional regulator [Chloroflexota bacterium]